MQQVLTESADRCREKMHQRVSRMRATCAQDVQRLSTETGASLKAKGSYASVQHARKMHNARRQVVGSSCQLAENVLEWVYDMAKQFLSNPWVVGCG
ncbi:hypothetical protein Pyn_29439 [Prunus yedoensis var. nudiflora]|uniref:Uncharacterized protein n=1 Tax=Prunus yedoensis var. nudiflora TaxID=2094558 RepID=A0A314UN11_PRUYE|nr:hypothetical protein Pyn_29439 [Prunus yedoensis var. nudiflora]